MANPLQTDQLNLIEASHAGQADLGTGIASALLRQVARGEVPPTMRLHRTGRILAFGRRDKLSPGYPRAVAIARDLGYEPIERMAGGRAAVFHDDTLAFSIASRTQGFATGTQQRFEQMATLVRDALAEIGVDARIGEVPGEYCPGEWSVNAGGATKLAGIGQRTISGGAHIGGVLVVAGADRVREALEPVYEALELDWNPATTGSVAAALGDDRLGGADADDLIAKVSAALTARVAQDYELDRVRIGESTMRLAEELRGHHASPR